MKIDINTIGGFIGALATSGIIPGGSLIAVVLGAAKVILDSGSEVDRKLKELEDYYRSLPEGYVPTLDEALANYNATANALREEAKART